jgi:hypothetical protein
LFEMVKDKRPPQTHPKCKHNIILQGPHVSFIRRVPRTQNIIMNYFYDLNERERERDF